MLAMKKSVFIFLFIVFGNSFVWAQIKSYSSVGTEMIFSFAKITKAGSSVESNLRWSPVFNFAGYMNYDGKNLGFFHGLAIRNVGFIYEPNADTLKKYRTYNIGIPVGLKLGNLGKGIFLYGGYEFEIPIHYKEKTFVNEDKKDKITVWFTNRVNWYTQSLFVGVNLPKGFNVKFKYYFNDFFSKDYVEAGTNPFKNFNANVFYIALDWNMFKDVNSYSNPNQKAKPAKKEERYSYNYQ